MSYTTPKLREHSGMDLTFAFYGFMVLGFEEEKHLEWMQKYIKNAHSFGWLGDPN